MLVKSWSGIAPPHRKPIRIEKQSHNRALILGSRINEKAAWRIPGENGPLAGKSNVDFCLKKIRVGVLLSLNCTGEKQANNSNKRDPYRRNFVAAVPSTAGDPTE